VPAVAAANAREAVVEDAATEKGLAVLRTTRLSGPYLGSKRASETDSNSFRCSRTRRKSGELLAFRGR